LAHLIIGRRVARGARLGRLFVLLLAALQNLSAPDQQSRINPERPTDETEDDDGSDTEPTAAKGQPETAAAIATSETERL